ncbi:response regulator transcription factor [Bradyrhizobium sp. STM 3562]|uniref:response regulator transcription factor n=1 Tax=Bradyrhizobium sp. STM 3562 TaxID=578924 RepID=UPI00388D6E0B
MIQIGSQTAPAVTAAAAKPTIYVVDDDVGVLGSLRFLLETDGFSVRTFRSGGALLNVPARGEIDCFVIDYKMPDINGIDLVTELRKRGEDAPVVLITGYPDKNIAARAAAAGVKHVMRKPLLEDSLIKQIRGAIDAHRPST